MIRKSTVEDSDDIEHLAKLCFGKRTPNILQNIDGRYYLYFVDDKLVSMSGINQSERFKGLEVDWTCTHPYYRNRGYMQELFREMLKDVNERVYCSCWRLGWKDDINLYAIMNIFDFKPLLRPRESFMFGHNCPHESCECVNYAGIYCTCYEDLYLREGNT